MQGNISSVKGSIHNYISLKLKKKMPFFQPVNTHIGIYSISKKCCVFRKEAFGQKKMLSAPKRT